jgi:hypothetical protein
MLDWLIIGGGMIGTSLSNHLVNAYGVSADKLRVLDPHPEPIARWTRLTSNTGMRYLRSPHVHHLDIDPLSMREFRQSEQGQHLGGTIAPYERPAYRLFQAHAESVIERCNLQHVREQGTAQFILSTRGGYAVETDQGKLKAKQVVLSLGRTHLHIPDWAATLRDAGHAIPHIFDRAFQLDAVLNWQHMVVIGGGITAGQVALHLANRQPGTVTLLMRHPIRQADLDSSPCWLGPKCRRTFRQARSNSERRRLIREARNRGSMSADIARDIRQAAREGRLLRQEGDIVSVNKSEKGFSIHLTDGQSLSADQILLATGFDGARPGSPWLDEVIDWFDLPIADCGYPIVDQQLQWQRGLHVTGSLAELELGPPAANIVGGRLAAERLRYAIT